MIERIVNWFRVAKPNPTVKDVAVQVGCHFEEVAEMLEATNNHAEDMHKMADFYKLGHGNDNVANFDKVEMLDALLDQIVTATGAGYMMGFDMAGALDEVMKSNESKFENGKAVFDENGKIKKGKDYFKPDLSRFVGDVKND